MNSDGLLRLAAADSWDDDFDPNFEINVDPESLEHLQHINDRLHDAAQDEESARRLFDEVGEDYLERNRRRDEEERARLDVPEFPGATWRKLYPNKMLDLPSYGYTPVDTGKETWQVNRKQLFGHPPMGDPDELHVAPWDERKVEKPIQRLNAEKKPAKPRKPEEVWYDVHKHPAGVPGGMGKSPEHHLRNRGWQPHEIHGAGSSTIQYRNPDHPDFVISFGGASDTHPNHNFRVLYMGTNRNIPKVNQAYSVAEAMNKVDELHEIHRGNIVLPMTHDSATRPPATLMGNKQPTQRQPRQFMAPAGPPNPPVTAPTYQLGKPKAEFPSGHTRGETNAQNPNKGGEAHELPETPAPTQKPEFSRKPPKQASVLELAQQSSWEQE